MSDGATAAAETQPANETVAPIETPVEPVNLEAPQGEEQPQEPAAIDLEEIDYEGEKYKVPTKLKNGFLMQSDYTRKTQEIADRGRALESREAAIKQEQESHRAHVQEIGRVLAINDQLAEFDKIDWAALNQSDPFRAQQLFQERMLLKDRRDGLISQLQAKEHERSQKAEQDFANRYAETNRTLAKDIPGWNQELANKLSDFAKANGATDSDIRTLAVNAPLVKLLHKAFIGDQLANAKTAAAKTANQPPAIKPMTVINGGGARTATRPEEAKDMASYVAARKAQGFGQPKR